MSNNFMFTCPSHHYNRKKIFEIIEDYDSHKWIVGFEIGKKGYHHIQGRINLSMGKEEGFNVLKKLDGAHIEECSDNWEYERKDGRFLSSTDTPEIRKVRFGSMNTYQKAMVENTLKSGDRDIVVWYNEDGGIGKSWMCNHLWETGKAYIVQCTDNVKSMVQDVASEYMNHGFRKILVIDIPRGWKWSSDMYVALERIKDGLIKDVRYNSKTINIRGVQVLVLTNSMPDTKKLSTDRWKIYKDQWVWSTI